MSPQRRQKSLLGLSKTNGVTAEVVDAVPFAKEAVTEDNERT
jgi:hypothetical protein